MYAILIRVVLHIPKFGDASKSPSGDTASPAGDVVASPNYRICDTVELIIFWLEKENLLLDYYGSFFLLTI